MTDRELMRQVLEDICGARLCEVNSMSSRGEAERLLSKAADALRERLAQPEQERWVWRNAAIRVGEELSSVGPVGYYDMTAAQWLDWAMAQEPRGKNSMAQPEQEPVAWANKDDLQNFDMRVRTNCDLMHTAPLYTAPPQRKPLTDEEIDAEWRELDGEASPLFKCVIRKFARAIEAKIKEKNT